MIRTAGIQESDKQNDLEDKVLRTLRKLGWNIASNILEAFNCVGRYNEVFIKCSKRKDYQYIFSVKKYLSKLDMKDTFPREHRYL